jgi:hypothetical protein
MTVTLKDVSDRNLWSVRIEPSMQAGSGRLGLHGARLTGG